MNKRAKVFIIAGMVLLAAALCLAAFNVWSDHMAGKTAQSALDRLVQEPSDAEPDYLIDPNMQMPVKNIDGTDYIGILRIPSLGLELPVAADWSYPQLRQSVCRYAGSAYADSMVICGHNYSSHFGNIKKLSSGDDVLFTDVDGNEFCYKVAGVEELRPNDTEEMKSEEWDLTIFTCTIGGASRVTVRCVAA